jgi:hypothetical protein
MGSAMVDRADVEVARFEVAEAAFGVAQALVGEDDAPTARWGRSSKRRENGRTGTRYRPD